jgi:hypothetical protein
MDSAALVAKNGGLGLQDPPWTFSQSLPTSNNETSPSHSPVLLTPVNASNFLEVMAQHGRRMTTWLSTVPTPFGLIPPTMVISFLPDFGLSDSEHDASAPPDNEARLHTIKDTAPHRTQELIGDIGPMAAYSL